MLSEEVLRFRERLNDDLENRDLRRMFHENFEWLESFWKRKFNEKSGDQIFCQKCGDFYWQLDEIKNQAKQFAEMKPVRSSKNNFEPTENIFRATYHLKYNASLFSKEDFEQIEKEIERGALWTNSSFKAVFDIVKQIRNNLFHGRKIDYESVQYERNRELVRIATDFTEILLDNLCTAERSIR